jgi:hypothetical protein
VEGREVFTDKSGGFRIDVAAGAWDLEVRHPDYAPTWVKAVGVPQGDELLIRLRRGGAAEFRVQTRSKKELSSACIRLRRVDHPEPGVLLFLDEEQEGVWVDGQVRFDHINPGTYLFSVDRGDPGARFGSALSREMEVEIGDETDLRPDDLEMEDGGCLVGWVMASPGVPIQEISFRALPAGTEGIGYPLSLSYEPQTGRYQAPCEPGVYDILVHAPPLSVARFPNIRVVSEVDTLLDIKLDKGIVWSGKVVNPAGMGLGGALVDLFQGEPEGWDPSRPGSNVTGNSAETKADGSFEMIGLEPRSYRVSVTHPQYAPSYGEVVISQAVAQKAFVLEPGATVRVKVTRAGQASPGQSVDLVSSPPGAYYGEAFSGPDGLATFGLVPPGLHAVYVMSQESSGPPEPHCLVNVLKGQTMTVDVQAP